LNVNGDCINEQPIHIKDDALRFAWQSHSGRQYDDQFYSPHRSEMSRNDESRL
jgi:hypothetical protein